MESESLGKLSLSARLSLYRRISLEIGYLAFRNVFILINLIIFAVVGLLIAFGATREGLSLGGIITLNIILGFGQDVNAWMVLERLQLLTALRVKRIGTGGTVVSVSPEELLKGDTIALALGDQVPCDGVLSESKNLEVSEAMITGESLSLPRKAGDRLLAGSIITAGSGIEAVEEVFRESRIAMMTARIKRYTLNKSPIQEGIGKAVVYCGWALGAVLVFVVVRGILTHSSDTEIVETIGALSAILVPQGLVIAATLLFAFGGIHFYRRHVLLREVNATERLARIKNLCLDKTGTLTENDLSVESLTLPPDASREEAERLTRSYIKSSGDSSQLIGTIGRYIGSEGSTESVESLPFSSWRQYGGVRLADGTVVLAGTPEVFMPHFAAKGEETWLQEVITREGGMGRRVFCLVKTRSPVIPQSLPGTSLSLAAVFILTNELRPGTRETITFFQERGVRIRVLSGDNTETIRAVVRAAGIAEPDALITGVEMEGWSQADFDAKAKKYTIFARIVPEQKEKIIEALKKDGYTAMVGDGANDALAIKKADIGIAMFDGTPATRQIAAVVLMRNSFTELPSGVRLADSIIENLEIYGAIFFNQTFLGFFLFCILAAANVPFPFSPLNISLASYFALGIPGILVSYWAIRPSGEVGKAGAEPFLKKIVPFSLVSGILEALLAAGIYLWALQRLSEAQASSLAVISFMILGYIFFALSPRVYSSGRRSTRWWELLGMAAIEIIAVVIAFMIPVVRLFFDITTVPVAFVVALLPVFAIYLGVQYGLARWFSQRREGKK